jgi:2-polyprenyl-3-methyl-5-hydroxy-6-metoxy-1,4-benzoquinol methylase
MKSYKQKIYERYLSGHNQQLYGENSLAKIKAAAPVFQHFYGRHLPADRTAGILEIGCGDGNFVYHLQQQGYTNVRGVDYSAELIEAGRRLGIADLHQADLSQFLSENQTPFDAIVAKDVIEHFTKEEAFATLELISKNLRDGGRFILQVPNGQGLFYASVFYGDFTHEVAYTESSLSQLALNTGFKRARCYPTGPIPTGVVAALRAFLWKIKVAELRFWKMVETGNPSGIFTQNIIAVMEK